MFREKSKYRLEEHRQWEEEIKRKKEAGELFCKACGTTISENYTHCPKCGNFLVGDEKVKSKEKTAKKEHKVEKKDKDDLFKEFKLSENKEFKKEQKEKVIEQYKDKKSGRGIKQIEISGGYGFLIIILSIIIGSIIGWYFFLRPIILEDDKSTDINIEPFVEPKDTGYPRTKTFDKYPGIMFEVNSVEISDLLKKKTKDKVTKHRILNIKRQ